MILKHNVHRIIKWVVIPVVIGIMLLSALYLLRGVFIAPYLQRYLEESIESQLGLRVDIGNISGTYITELVVTNVTTLKPALHGPLVALELRRFKVTYNLLSLLRGLNGFLTDASIELKGAKLKFDLSGGETISAAPSETGFPQSFFLPQQLPQIRIQDTTVFLRGSSYETVFKGIDLKARHTQLMTSTIQLHVPQWRWTHPDLQDGSTTVIAAIEYSKEKILIKSLKLGTYELAEFVQIGLNTLPEIIPFDAKLNLAGGQIALEGKLDHSDLQTRIKAQNIELARIFSLFRPQQIPLSGSLSIKADILLPRLRPNDMVADLDFKLIRGNLFGLVADDLFVRAAAKEGALRLNTLDLRNGANLIAFQEVKVSAARVFDGDFSGILESMTGRFSFDCRDVPSLFLLAGVDFSSATDSIPVHRLLLNGELHHGNISLFGGGLTAGNGYIRLDPSQIALPTKNRPLKDTPIQAALKINLPDLGLLSRIFAIPQLGGSLHGNVTVTGALGFPNGTVLITGEGISVQGMTYGDLTIQADSDSHTAVIESLALQQGEDRLEGRGKFHFLKQELEDVHFDFLITDLAQYVENLWPQSWKLVRGKPQISGSIDGKVTLTGPIRMPRGALAAKIQRLKFEENQVGDATLQLHSNGRMITVEAFEVRQSKDRIALNGSYDLTAHNFENVNLEIAIADLAAYTKNLLPKERPITASVNANLKISGPLREPEAQADITLKQLQLNGFNILNATLTAHSSGRRISIDLAEADTSFGQAKFSGHLHRGPADADFDLEITALTLSTQDALLALDKPGNIHFTRDGEIFIKDMSLSGPTGGIRLKGAAAVQKKTDLDIIVSDFSSHGWFESLATDRVNFSGLNARIRLFGTLDAPSLSITGDLAELGGQKDRISLSANFDLSYTKDGVIIRQFEWRGRQGQQIAVTGIIPVNLLEKPVLRPGSLAVDATVSIPDLRAFDFYYPDYLPSDGELQGKLRLTGTWNAPSGTFMFQCRGLNDPPYFRSMPPGPIGIDGIIQLDANNMVLKSIQINSPHLTFTSQGEWTGMPMLADLLQGETGKPLGNVALKGNLSVEDLSWLAAENPSLRRVSGRLEANMSMKGPVSNPAVNAIVRLSDGELRPDMDVPSLQALNLEAVVTPSDLQIQKFTGELGGAPFQITGSVIRNNESDARADIRLQGENLLFYRSEGLKLRADTDLSVKGPFSRLKLAGEVAITDGRLVKYFDFLSTLRGSAKPKTDTGLQLFSIRKPPFRDIVFDVRLTSKNPFTIHNNLAKGSVRPELTLTGTGEFPVLSGKIYVDPTRLILPAGSLVFESGIIRFDPNRPDRPTLDLIGKSRLLGYDITMLVEGPYDEPVVTLSSIPPLSNQELLLLLIAGQPPKATEDPKASQRQSMNIAVFLGRDLISRWFGSESAEAGESITDRFEVRVGRAVTRAGDETVDAQFRVAESVLRDGDTLYITGEKDVFDFYNAGVKLVFRFK